MAETTTAPLRTSAEQHQSRLKYATVTRSAYTPSAKDAVNGSPSNHVEISCVPRTNCTNQDTGLTHQHTTEIISTPQRSLCTAQTLQHLPSIPTSPTACCADSGMGAATASGRSRRWGRRHPCRWPGGGGAGRAGGASESPRAECRGHDFPSLGGMGSRAARFRKRMGEQKATRRDAVGDKQACGADEGVE